MPLSNDDYTCFKKRLSIVQVFNQSIIQLFIQSINQSIDSRKAGRNIPQFFYQKKDIQQFGTNIINFQFNCLNGL